MSRLRRLMLGREWVRGRRQKIILFYKLRIEAGALQKLRRGANGMVVEAFWPPLLLIGGQVTATALLCVIANVFK